MADELISYCEIRKGFLDCFYEYRRQLIINARNQKTPSVEQCSEVGYASYQWENAYDLPVENLILDVLTLIMLAGTDSAIPIENLNKSIQGILDKYTMEELLQGIDEDSKSDLVYDLILLGFIKKPAE